MTLTAVVPVAFFTSEHVSMTDAFLTHLTDEVDSTIVFHNGGPLELEGWRMLAAHAPDVHFRPAAGWPFYRMWNEGIREVAEWWDPPLDEDVVLVLNNDIEWDPGALRSLGDFLASAEPDVAIASPCPAGEPRWCFAIRPKHAPVIDERYHTWYGDTELELLIDRAGLRRLHCDPGIRHPHIQTTTDHLPDVQALRLIDEALFTEKWVT